MIIILTGRHVTNVPTCVFCVEVKLMQPKKKKKGKKDIDDAVLIPTKGEH